MLAARVNKQRSFWDIGGSPLSPTGNAAEVPPRGEPLECGVEYVRGVVDYFGCLSEGLLAKYACKSSDGQTDDFRAHWCGVLHSVPVLKANGVGKAGYKKSCDAFEEGTVKSQHDGRCWLQKNWVSWKGTAVDAF